MARKELKLFGLGLHGKSPNVTANKLVNAYYEFQKEEDRTNVAIYGTPGLTLFLDQGDTPWRGLHPFPGNSTLYGVHRGTFYSINNAAVATARGTIGTTSGRVDITDDGTRVAVVDGEELYYYDTSSPATPIAAAADADRPTSPNTCCFQGGRILTDEDGTGQFKGSGTYSTAWDALDFATAESNPDNVIRLANYKGNIPLFGSYTIEFWARVTGSGFPFTRILGTDLQYGLAARWSLGKFMGSYAFLAQNREGEVMVAKLDGYNLTRISNFELEHIINNDYSSVADATGFGYSLGGHPMYQLNFPSAGKSWLYDGSTDYWSELQSGSGRHRAEIGVDFLNQRIVADYENGKLYKIDPGVYTENGATLAMQVTGKHLFQDNAMIRLDRLEINGQMGVGTATGQGVDPQMMLQLSKDGGTSFGTEQWASMGAIGEGRHRCVFTRMGSGRDIVPRITITDPVKRVLTTAVLFADVGR